MIPQFNFDEILFIASILLLISVFASKISTKFGIPALLLFIVVGMLAGSDGPLGIQFEDFHLTHKLGYLALIFILFGGGLDTHWDHVKPILIPGILLATFGVFITAFVVGYAGYLFFGLSLLEGLLLGAIVSSTDAAAVFGVLRAQGLRLKGGLTHLLEFESGVNDPMAVFLTVGLTSLLLHPEINVLHLIPELVQEMVIGGIGGVAIGKTGAWLINRIHLAYDGLYNVFTVAIALFSYSSMHTVGGNGFLAVYAAGVALGSKPFVHRISLIQFHEGLAWLMQIVMFLALGLLVFPSQLLPRFSESMIVALVLVFIARPIAVALSIGLSRKFTFPAKTFISWAGLRGSVPIILSTIPLTEGLPIAPAFFNIVFFVVLVSVLVQGTFIRLVAKLLGIIVEGDDHVSERKVSSTKLEVKIPHNSRAIGKSVVELSLPSNILLVLHTRDGESHIPRGNTVLHAGDVILIQAEESSSNEVRRIFGAENE